MKLVQITLLLTFTLSAVGADKPALKLEEVLSVIRTNMTDISEAELSSNAALGLIKELGTKVQLIEDGAENGTNRLAAATYPDPIPKTAVFEEKFGYLRIKSIDERLTNEFHRRATELLGSNGLAGLVIDLRYAAGTNYQAAAAVADEFAGGGEPLVRLGEVRIVGTDRATDIRKPVAVLVNAETHAAAEALAGMLRESAAALVIGSQTAGEARLYEVFTLSTGHRLRVGKVPVEVGRGKAIPATGIAPDIKVEVSEEEEKYHYQDPYRARLLLRGSGGTNEVASGFTRGRPVSEAELVRRHRNGLDFQEEEEAAAPERAVVTDPALARALDFLKGISIVKPRRQG